MTTTLRPAGPERRETDGTRARTYAVCVNGRPVGRVELACDGRYGRGTGRIEDLTVDRPDRRRGRGTVAALAAEEVLRDWGCRRIEVSVPAGAAHVLRMAGSLGYAESRRHLSKDLARRPPRLPPGSSARPLTEAEYAPWLAREREEYLDALTATGLSREQAEAQDAAAVAGLLPSGGQAAPGTALLGVDHHGELVARLWLRTGEPPWVMSVEVEPAHRGRGHGRAAMLAAEQATRAAGARSLGLNVFTGNTPALRLYESLGYRPVAHRFAKALL
jgi:GNAT superfamily N-acetyltransferase